jgi:hypothetical protein
MKTGFLIKFMTVMVSCALLCWIGCDNDKNTLKPDVPDGPDTEVPHVVITEPDSGASVPEGEYCHVVAEAWDNVGIVVAELFIDNVKWGEDLRDPFEFDFFVSPQYPDHVYTIYVRVADAAGNSRKSTKVVVTSYDPDNSD